MRRLWAPSVKRSVTRLYYPQLRYALQNNLKIDEHRKCEHAVVRVFTARSRPGHFQTTHETVSSKRLLIIASGEVVVACYN